jgi:hypothetical protein
LIKLQTLQVKLREWELMQLDRKGGACELSWTESGGRVVSVSELCTKSGKREREREGRKSSKAIDLLLFIVFFYFFYVLFVYIIIKVTYRGIYFASFVTLASPRIQILSLASEFRFITGNATVREHLFFWGVGQWYLFPFGLVGCDSKKSPSYFLILKMPLFIFLNYNMVPHSWTFPTSTKTIQRIGKEKKRSQQRLVFCFVFETVTSRKKEHNDKHVRE